MKKRIFKAALAVILVLSAILVMSSCGNTSAKVKDAESASGAVGQSTLTWNYDASSKTLTVNGSGAMPDFADSASVSWYAARHSIEKIVISEGITSIGSYAFYYSPALQTVTIPASVTGIGSFAFAHCASLKTVSLPASLASIGDYCFEGCASLESIFVPASVTALGEGAFAYCAKLKNASIMAHLTEIKANTFKNCKAIETLLFSSVCADITVADTAFDGASKNFGRAEFLASDTGEATLTVLYLYEDGSEAAEPYTAKLALGATYSHNSPSIEGYNASALTVSGTISKDTEIKVTYTPVSTEPEAPAETPDTEPATDTEEKKPTSIGTIIAIVVFVVVIAGIVVFAVFTIRSDKKAQGNTQTVRKNNSEKGKKKSK